MGLVHKYGMNGLYIVLDANSGSVHAVDKIIYDILDFYKGADGETRADNVKSALAGVYGNDELDEALSELLELESRELLFAKDEFSGLAGGGDVIKAMCLLVAQDCNLRCEYCFADEGEYNGKRGMMSFDTAKKAVDLLISRSGNRKNLEIDFFGGEPLMNFDVVKQTVEYARSLEEKNGKCFRFTITTNGVLLDDDTINYINENMYNVVLSLDGRKSVNDRVRKKVGGQGSYDSIMPNFKRLVAKRADKSYYVRGTFTAYNMDFSNDALHLAELGFKHISVEPVVSADSFAYALRDEHLPALFEEYEKLAKVIAKRQNTPEAFNFFHFIVDLDGGPCAKKRVSGCGAGVEYIAVCSDGSLYPCHQFAGMGDRFLLGSVHDGVTNSKLVEEFAASGIYSKPDCRECFAKFYCGGGCPANAYNAAGDINKTYALGCALQKKRTECAIMIKAANIKEDGFTNEE